MAYAIQPSIFFSLMRCKLTVPFFLKYMVDRISILKVFSL